MRKNPYPLPLILYQVKQLIVFLRADMNLFAVDHSDTAVVEVTPHTGSNFQYLRYIDGLGVGEDFPCTRGFAL